MNILSFSCSSLLALTAQLGLFTCFIYFLIWKVNYIQAWMMRENQSNFTEILTVLKFFYFPLYLISLLVLNILFNCILQDILHPVRKVKNNNNNCWNYFLIENQLEKELYTITRTVNWISTMANYILQETNNNIHNLLIILLWMRYQGVYFTWILSLNSQQALK